MAKWGGSLLTNKGQAGARTFRKRIARRLAQEWVDAIADAPGVIVHGAGSFGHPQALAHGIGRRRLAGDALRAAVIEVRGVVHDLQARVVDALRDVGAPAVAVPAATAAHLHGNRLDLHPGPFLELIDHGFLPVTGGDVVFDPRLGLRILSGDEIVRRLAGDLHARRAVFATDVDGLVLDGRRIVELPARAGGGVLSNVKPGADATGGMRGKLEAALALQKGGIDVVLVHGGRAGRFAAAVAGRDVEGTFLPAAKRRI